MPPDADLGPHRRQAGAARARRRRCRAFDPRRSWPIPPGFARAEQVRSSAACSLPSPPATVASHGARAAAPAGLGPDNAIEETMREAFLDHYAAAVRRVELSPRGRVLDVLEARAFRWGLVTPRRRLSRAAARSAGLARARRRGLRRHTPHRSRPAPCCSPHSAERATALVYVGDAARSSWQGRDGCRRSSRATAPRAAGRTRDGGGGLIDSPAARDCPGPAGGDAAARQAGHAPR